MTQTDLAISAIRKIDVITCDDLRGLLNVIASKMAEAGFSSTDLDVIDEVADFTCGEAA
jgi:hypothetical protein